MDDTWMEANTIVAYLTEMLADKLLSHDQKKLIKKVNMGKEPEEKLSALNMDLNQFYHTFASSLKNMFGYVSYKSVLKYLDQL